jgi:hypothetical protein
LPETGTIRVGTTVAPFAVADLAATAWTTGTNWIFAGLVVRYSLEALGIF